MSAGDTGQLERFSAVTNAFLLAVDTDTVLNQGVIDFIIPSGSSNCKRIVAMTRKLIGKGVGFFVKASKLSANNEVWSADDALVMQYKQFEASIKQKTNYCHAEYYGIAKRIIQSSE